MQPVKSQRQRLHARQLQRRRTDQLISRFRSQLSIRCFNKTPKPAASLKGRTGSSACSGFPLQNVPADRTGPARPAPPAGLSLH
uniref:Uncharacterized protein n=1 Tax=Myripristis murdjan TaxID=586833 RepID=A0A667WT65_9TELE